MHFEELIVSRGKQAQAGPGAPGAGPGAPGAPPPPNGCGPIFFYAQNAILCHFFLRSRLFLSIILNMAKHAYIYIYFILQHFQ